MALNLVSRKKVKVFDVSKNISKKQRKKLDVVKLDDLPTNEVTTNYNASRG